MENDCLMGTEVLWGGKCCGAGGDACTLNVLNITNGTFYVTYFTTV